MVNQTMREIRFKRIATDSELQPIAYEKNVFDFIPLFFYPMLCSEKHSFVWINLNCWHDASL